MGEGWLGRVVRGRWWGWWEGSSSRAEEGMGAGRVEAGRQEVCVYKARREGWQGGR